MLVTQCAQLLITVTEQSLEYFVRVLAQVRGAGSRTGWHLRHTHRRSQRSDLLAGHFELDKCSPRFEVSAVVDFLRVLHGSDGEAEIHQRLRSLPGGLVCQPGLQGSPEVRLHRVGARRTGIVSRVVEILGMSHHLVQGFPALWLVTVVAKC
jgi:hypothetical protein